MAFVSEPDTARRVKTSLPAEYQHIPAPAPVATALGLFSVGLGLAELLAPRSMASATGVHSTSLLRAYGLRELASGIGILTSRRPAGWLWSRVAGDAMDLATLAVAAFSKNQHTRQRAWLAAAAVAGVTAVDVLCACEHSNDAE